MRVMRVEFGASLRESIVGTSSKVIAVLEDNPERAAAMTSALQRRLPDVETIFFDNAPDMVAWLRGNLASVCLLSLDHDLGPNRKRDGRSFDPGVGRDVVALLERSAATCRVLIHSSNSRAAEGMFYALQFSDWSVERVYPFGDLSWVDADWIDRVVSGVTDAPAREPDQLLVNEYADLREALGQGEWRKAENLTISRLCLLAGRGPQPAHMVPEAVARIPCEHLRVICNLWDDASNGRYGFIVQAKIWAQVGGPIEVLTSEGTTREEKLALGYIERTYARRVGLARDGNPSLIGHFPILQCSYGFGMVGLLVAAFSHRLVECGLVELPVPEVDRDEP
jgi:hypothetical protein